MPRESPAGCIWTAIRCLFVPGATAGFWAITWAKETEFDLSFWNGAVNATPLVQEAWVVVWPENLGTTQFQEGINLDVLKADYQALTGSPLVLP